jgi:F-type H+-transporting ATPase subunit b
MQMLTISEEDGGLFDFDATLPFVAIVFVLLIVELTRSFYKPVSKILEGRERLINVNLENLTNELLKVFAIGVLHDTLRETRLHDSQRIVTRGGHSALDFLQVKFDRARQYNSKLIRWISIDLATQRSLAMQEVGKFSRLRDDSANLCASVVERLDCRCTGIFHNDV